MFKNLMRILSGDPNKRDIDRYSGVVARINDLEQEFRALSDEQLRGKTDAFKDRITAAREGLTDDKDLRAAERDVLDEILPEAFATVREAAMRTLGQRHYDVQLIGGMILHEGRIAEMRTGEGKTLVSTLPTYLNALLGRGVHVITVNDYLARRDARWMGQIYNALGLSVGVLQDAHRTENAAKAFIVDFAIESPQEDRHHLRLVPRRETYACDITYGTNNEFGFDYLRDNMAMALEQRVQRERFFAIVDEVDNILIDEARTPLIISGPAQDDPRLYLESAKVVRQLTPEHFEIDERGRGISLTELGEAHLERLLRQPLRDPDRPEELTPEQARLLGHIEQAMRAEFIYKRNKDYLVQNGQIVIVDEFTGRMMPGRRWSDGLHQAVEAKEGVKVQQDNVTYATITLQNFFRLYAKLAGMTGTALTEAEEFERIYNLTVLPVPPHLEYTANATGSALTEVKFKEEGQTFTYFARKDDGNKTPVFWRRKDYPDLVFRTEESKLRAIVGEILRRHLVGQPMLIGTTSVEMSEHVSERLRPEALQRLALVLLLRDAWFRKNKKEEDGMLVQDLQPLDAPLDQLSKNDMAVKLREYGLSTNPAGEENAARLCEILGSTPDRGPELTRVLGAGIKHNVLNAKKHDAESLIIADAGAYGAVTIATNMAGRGVDIKLGGELSEEVITAVNRVIKNNTEADPYNLTHAQRRELLRGIPESDWGVYENEARTFVTMMDDVERVRAVGGLHVLGSERHESRRIDNQLRGRAARQGDPGSSQFYLSLEDELMKRFGGQGVSDLMQRLRIDDSVPIQAGLVNRTIESAQTRVEGSNFDIRKHLIEYDDVLNSQRNTIYGQRDRIFVKDDLSDDFDEMLVAEVDRRVKLHADPLERWKLFAWADETQPPILDAGPEGERLFPTYGQSILLRDVAAADDKRQALITLAGDALKAEREHVLEAIQGQLSAADERLGGQMRERKMAAEEALEGLENEARETGHPIEPRAALKAVSEVLGINVQLPATETRDFDYNGFKRRLEDLAQAAVTARSRVALIAAVERRLGGPLNLGEMRSDEEWADLQEKIQAAAEKTFDTKVERVIAEVERDIKSNLPEHMTEAQWTRGLLAMQFGRSVGFDKQHRKVEMNVQRLHYAYLVGDMTSDWKAEELREELLAHLRSAVDRQRDLFARAEAQLRTLGGTPTEASDTLGRQVMTNINRSLMLQTIGNLWVEYLTSVEALRTSIGLEAYAQRDPLVAYKSKATDMFQELLANIRAGVVSRALQMRPRIVQPTAAEASGAAQPAGANATASAEPPARPRPSLLEAARLPERPTLPQINPNAGQADTAVAPDSSVEAGSAEDKTGGRRRRRRR